MKKIILTFVVLFSNFPLFAAPVLGPNRIDLIQSQILLPNSDVKSFDGNGFKLKDAALRAAISGYGRVDVNSEKKTLQVSNELMQYKLDWKRQDFENGSDVRMNQAMYLKQENDLRLFSTTYNGDYLRSITHCEGSLVNAGATNKEVYCATATKNVCKEVLEAYRKNDNLRTPGVSAQKSKELADAKVKSCVETMKGYSEVLKAFHKRHTGNEGVWNNHTKIIKQEEKEMSDMLGAVEGGSRLKMNYVNTLEGDDFAKVADKLTSSMSGLNQVNSFIGLCNDHQSNFAPDEPQGGASGDKAPPKNRR
jgi:hypothetical protein